MAMIITMALPILGLLFFFFLPFWTALPFYLCCLIFLGLMYYGMFSVMGGRRRVQAGVEKFIDEEAVVVEDLNPSGKVEIDDEIWKAMAKDKRFQKGKKGRISGAQGLTLIAEDIVRDWFRDFTARHGKQARWTIPPKIEDSPSPELSWNLGTLSLHRTLKKDDNQSGGIELCSGNGSICLGYLVLRFGST
jgi:membrane protein implicated in regulation of membrane protease activity